MHSYVTSRSASEPTAATAAASAAALSASVEAPSAAPSAAASSTATSVSRTAERLNNRGTFVQQKPLASEVSSVDMPDTMDLRDRLFAGISEENSEGRDDDGAEVIIEPDGQIRVHPRRRPNYLRSGGSLEPPAFRTGVGAERGAIERDARTAEDLLLLRLIQHERQDRGGHASGMDSLLEDQIRKLLVEEATAAGRTPHAFAQLETRSRSDPDSSSGTEPRTQSNGLTSPAGYLLAFVVGFGGILLIAMMCCVIRAAYVKRQKARLKKLLAEKLRDQRGEEPEQPGLPQPASYEVVESDPNAPALPEYPTADEDWIDVRVEQQAPPEEQQMMNVARLDTLSKAGLPTESTEQEKRPEQLPFKSKKKKKKSADVGLWAEEESDREKARARLKSRKKSSKAGHVQDAPAGREEDKRRRTTRREKELKKALSSRRTLRLAG